MPRSVDSMACRLGSSCRRRLGSPLSRPARPTGTDLFRLPWRIADEKTMLHLGDDLAGEFQLGRDPVDTVGVQPDDRLGDHGGRVQLVRNRNPVVAPEAPFPQPAAHLAPPRRLMRTLPLDAPQQARPTMPLRIAGHANDPQ